MNVDVYFDDYSVAVAAGPVVQVDDYYPYRMSFRQQASEHEVLNRYGFQGKELVEETGWYDFHARMYSPALGRFLATDPQGQFHSPYMGMGNNPVVMVDPDGEIAFLAVAVAAYLLFTETGYDIQKFVSPVALHVDIRLGTHQRGIGVDASVGIPKAMPVSYRVHGGASYYWKNYDVQPGFETRYGAELSAGFGLVAWGGTHYNSPGEKFDQTTNYMMLGLPGLNFKYENDYFFDLSHPLIPRADGGDRHRTAAAKLQVGIFDVGINFFTGDPGLSDRETDIINGRETYVFNPRTRNDPDEFRAGVGYIGIGPFRFGNDRESRRHKIQNELIHDNLNPPSPYFRVLNRRNRGYFQFGGGGGSLW